MNKINDKIYQYNKQGKFKNKSNDFKNQILEKNKNKVCAVLQNIPKQSSYF